MWLPAVKAKLSPQPSTQRGSQPQASTQQGSQQQASTQQGSQQQASIQQGSQPQAAVANAVHQLNDPCLTPMETMTGMRLFHERMGHVNTKDCAALAAKQGIKLLETADFTCDVCATAKQRKHPMPALAERQDVVPGEILHCDLKHAGDPHVPQGEPCDVSSRQLHFSG